MKNIKKYINLATIAVALPLVFTQCTDPSYPTPSVGTQTSSATSNMLFVNVLSNDATVDLKIDNVVVSSALVTGNTPGYLAMNVGPRFVDVSVNGLTATLGGGFPWRTATASSSSSLTAAQSSVTGTALGANVATLKSNNPWLFAGGAFTVIVQGSATSQNTRLVLIDNLTTPASGKANVRLINAVPSGVTNALIGVASSATLPTANVTYTLITPTTINGLGVSTVGSTTTTIGTSWSASSYLTVTGLKAYNASATASQSFVSIDPTLSLQIYDAPTISTVSGLNVSTVSKTALTTVNGLNISTTTQTITNLSTTNATAIALPITSLQAGGIYTLILFKKNGTYSVAVIKHN
jgi:hypothetical protein